MSQYLQHLEFRSTVFRSFSTSKANNVGLCLKDIEKAAGWRGTSTFRKHYNLPLFKNFAEEICWEKTLHSVNLVIQLY